MAPLRHLSFRLLVAGQLVSNFEDAIYSVAMPWSVLAHHGGAPQLGTVLAAYGVPRTALLVVGGHASDRYRPWTVIQQPFVVAAGEGESDPEWRYRTTKTLELEGAHKMAMLVELDPDTAAEAIISLSGTVIVERTSVDAVWGLDDPIARVPLVAPPSRDGV